MTEDPELQLLLVVIPKQAQRAEGSSIRSRCHTTLLAMTTGLLVPAGEGPADTAASTENQKLRLRCRAERHPGPSKRKSGRQFDGVFVAENANGFLELLDFERLL
jgi:hypothetical protein